MFSVVKHVTIRVSLLANILAYFYFTYIILLIIFCNNSIIISGRCTKYFACGEKDVGINHEQMFGMIPRCERNEKTCDVEYSGLLDCYAMYTGE